MADKTCDFDLVFEAWQEGLGYGTGGFTDIETISSSVKSEHWTSIANHLVVNEVYYDVASDKGSEGDNEWVEIYNPTSSKVNLKNWEICDKDGCDTVSSGDLEILANGYAVITNKATTWDFWSVPGNALKIELNSKIGKYGLANAGDSVILKDNNGNEVDAMSYGNIGAAYTPAFDPTCSLVAEGYSLARKPAGQDTNTRDDFEELASPNPGTNPHTVVMNEIMPNPIGDDDEKMPGGEWVELYNFGEYDIDLKDWKFENSKGDSLEITEKNTESEKTIIKAGEILVVYRNGGKNFYLDDDGDEVRLLDEQGLIKDSHKFESTPEGKTIARFPDAVGPWVDPDPTPGEKNEMNDTEKNQQTLIAYEKCFKNDELNEKEKYEPICQVEYLRYLELIVDLDDEKINPEFLDKIKEEETKEEEPSGNTEENLVENLEEEADRKENEDKSGEMEKQFFGTNDEEKKVEEENNNQEGNKEEEKTDEKNESEEMVKDETKDETKEGDEVKKENERIITEKEELAKKEEKDNEEEKNKETEGEGSEK